MDLTRDRDPNVRATAAVTLAKVVEEGDSRVADRYAILTVVPTPPLFWQESTLNIAYGET